MGRYKTASDNEHNAEICIEDVLGVKERIEEEFDCDGEVISFTGSQTCEIIFSGSDFDMKVEYDLPHWEIRIAKPKIKFHDGDFESMLKGFKVRCADYAEKLDKFAD